MKQTARIIYNEPIVFLALVQGLVTAGAAAGYVGDGAFLVLTAGIVALQRHLVRPVKRSRR